MRTGSELLQATKPFAVEDAATTWRLAASTLALLVLAFAGAVYPGWPLPGRIAAAVLLGLVTVRWFIFYHDYLHSAIWTRSRLGKVLMHLSGFWFLAPVSVWRETHNYHHKNNAKLVGSAIGSFPTVTTGMWRGMNEKQRRAYRIARHPLTIFGGYFTVFIFGMCISAFLRSRKHWQGPAALLLHFGGAAALSYFVDPWSGLLGVILPLFIASGLGTFLFYVQHNFPQAEFRSRRDWDYVHAALKSSSMFDMSPVMHWFTGNIGYHHVHHLNHRIPFYRLPEAMAAIPELQSPGRVSWRLSDIASCLRLRLWDPERGRMVGFDEVPEETTPTAGIRTEAAGA